MTEERELLEHRAFVVKLAYRMLGSTSDAEDIAQEAYLRLRGADRSELRSPRAWLTRVTTRLCLDRLKSAEATRMQYPGEQLPEPLVEPRVGGGEDRLELDESLSMALLAMVQRLQPSERAAFLLHDVFGYAFDEVAEVLGLETANCRQLAVRARRHLELDRVRSDATAADVERISDAFFDAIETGDVERLRSVLAHDVELRSDGGGKVAAARVPLHGVDAVLKFLVKVLAQREPSPVLHRRREWFNGAPGVVVCEADGQPVTAFHFLIQGGHIRGIYAQRNPDKLGGLKSGD